MKRKVWSIIFIILGIALLFFSIWSFVVNLNNGIVVFAIGLLLFIFTGSMALVFITLGVLSLIKKDE